MTLADELLPVVHWARSIPGKLGIWTAVAVEIVETSYSGGNTGIGQPAPAIRPIVEGEGFPPSVEQLTSEQLALGGYRPGSVLLGPITPPFEVAGVWYGTDSNLFRATGLSSGDTMHVRIRRRNGASERYVVAKVDDSSSTATFVTLSPLDGSANG